VQITPFGGVNEIGGNKMLVEHEQARIMLDFGLSFKQSGLFFSEFLNPRKAVGMDDHLETGLLPWIEGIYRDDYLEHMGRVPGDRSLDAVFLSHAHADHADMVHFLRRDIPIYCSEETKRMFQADEAMGSDGFDDYTMYKPTFQFRAALKGPAKQVRLKSNDPGGKLPRTVEALVASKPVTIKGIELRAYPVDHSLPGAMGFIIKAGQRTLVYTGDIRFHGFRTAESNAFVDAAKAARPQCLVCEGTRIDDPKAISEADVEKHLVDGIAAAKGLVFVEYNYRDLDRAVSIYRAAKKNGRTFVASMKLANLLATMDTLSPIPLNDIKVYIPKRSWGLLGSTTAPQEQILQDYTWERDLVVSSNAVTAADLAKAQAKYVVTFTFWDINQLVDIKPKDATWIKSSTEPFSAEMILDDVRRQNWLKLFKVTLVKEQTHASGHASQEELLEMIKKIQPEKVVPVHTEKPDEFDRLLKGTGIKVEKPSWPAKAITI
jgi:ribonuclease J